MKQSATVLLVIALALLCVAADPASLGTAFTYQGRLKDAGLPATGVYDFEFKLFDESVAGSQIAATVTKDDVSVAEGLFTVSLDFGGLPFKGSARFLEISVRPGASTGAYTALLGRHELTPSPYALSAASARTYRWAAFHTYHEGGGWADADDPRLFGGIPPSEWTNNNAVASSLSSDKGVLGALFNNTKTISSNGNSLVYAQTFLQYSSTTGNVTAALFRVRNTTAGAIVWTPVFRYTSYLSWSETASLTLNGANSWTSAPPNCGWADCIASVPLSIPTGQISTVIVVAISSPPLGLSGVLAVRSSLLAFLNGSLNLPPGLEFVDDLDTAENGWNK